MLIAEGGIRWPSVAHGGSCPKSILLDVLVINAKGSKKNPQMGHGGAKGVWSFGGLWVWWLLSWLMDVHGLCLTLMIILDNDLWWWSGFTLMIMRYFTMELSSTDVAPLGQWPAWLYLWIVPNHWISSIICKMHICIAYAYHPGYGYIYLLSFWHLWYHFQRSSTHPDCHVTGRSGLLGHRMLQRMLSL